MSTRLAQQSDYAARQRAARAANLAEFHAAEAPTVTDRLGAFLTPANVDALALADADDVAAALAVLATARYSRRLDGIDADAVRATAAVLVGGLLLKGHTPADAARLALHRADRRAVESVLAERSAAAGTGTGEDTDAADALARAAAEADPGAEWVPCSPTTAPDALRIVQPLTPEDADAIGRAALSPLLARILTATEQANEGADVRALTHRRTCRKPAAKPSACCRRDVIAPALRTSVVALAVTGSNSGPARTRTKRDQIDAGARYLAAQQEARRARTEADAAAWDDVAEAQRDRRHLAGFRIPGTPEQAEPARVSQMPAEEFRRLYVEAAHRLAVASVANGERPRRTASRVGDMPEALLTITRTDADTGAVTVVQVPAVVMPHSPARGAEVMPDPEHLQGETRTGQAIGYDLAKTEQHDANRDARQERQADEDAHAGDDAQKVTGEYADRLQRAETKAYDQAEAAHKVAHKHAAAGPVEKEHNGVRLVTNPTRQTVPADRAPEAGDE